ncbi:TonB-dependent receptor [candidate division GN15 bacterium]|nr:TonB-dependent receptor [candidate division GN15 bacterium]
MQGVGIAGRFTKVLLLLVLLLLPLQVFGQTGQIKGQVTDKESGEPVLGASVLVEGTSMGAMTDADGRYQILRVDIGEYNLRVSHLDYDRVQVTGVVVNDGLTTEQNVELTQKVTDIGKTIEVRADTDIIEKFEVSNKAKITAEQIQTKPVQNVDALLQQVAGVQTNATGEVFVRGGRAGEVSYIVDGVEVNNTLGGAGTQGANLSLVSGSIQEIQIIKDGFDPEYGNALSGIVNIKTQTGSKDNTNINMQYITDDLGNADLNEYSRNYDFARFSISGPDPLLKDKVLPALGLNFLRDKEFTYYFYAEVSKDDDFYPMQDYDTPVTARQWPSFSVFGLDIPERARNRTYWMGNLKFKPRPNLNFVLSYKSTNVKNTRLFGAWSYRYSTATLPVVENNWQSLSLEMSQSLSRTTTYEVHLSYFANDVTQRPGDPDNPGRTLDPDDFTLQGDWESYTDANDNGMYDPPEPIINLFPDTAVYGTDFTGPAYTFGELNLEFDPLNPQGGQLSDFRFNDNGVIDVLEGEPFIDLNGNGVWDAGDQLQDKNGNGQLDVDRIQVINNRSSEPFVDGDLILGEPYTDLNRNGVYDRGIDLFIRSADPETNQDLNYNGQYDGPEGPWEPGLPYLDRNNNGVYDAPNFQYDPGEAFTDLNGNGQYDYGGSSTFLDPGNYDEEAIWSDKSVDRWRGELQIYHQMGNHELKLGGNIIREDFSFVEIQRPYLSYTGRSDGGPYPTRGAFRDVFSYTPWRGAVYFRDKLEYGSMIASLGFRWDFFLQDTDDLIDVAVNDDLGSGLIEGDRQKFSPRIGFSYPISDKAKVHFNYGHFFQLPDYQWMYARNTASVDVNRVVGNYNLDYQKTIQYSFGVKYAMSEYYSIDISGYFKDEFDKINSQSVDVGGLTRQQYRNSDYGRSRGFEVTLDKRGGGYVTGQISYTYAFAFGKASQTNEEYLEDFELSNEPLSETPLNNDIRHSLKAAITFYIPGNVKPRLFGLPIPNGWSMSIESIIESGRPFTPSRSYPGISQSTAEAIENNSLRYPATAVFDARFAKEFGFAGLDFEGILWVENVFDSRNVQFVYSNTGRPDTQQNINQVIKGGTPFDANPYNWDYGRQIRVGLEVKI